MRYKWLLIPLAFLLITVPGAIESWLSLADRIRGEPSAVSIDLGNIWELYGLAVPILGLVILLGGLWWIEKGNRTPRKETEPRNPSPSRPTAISGGKVSGLRLIGNLFRNVDAIRAEEVSDVTAMGNVHEANVGDAGASGGNVEIRAGDAAPAPERVIALTSAPVGSFEHKAAQLSTLMIEARKRLIHDIFVYNSTIDWGAIVTDNPHILFRFDIHSGSIYMVKVGSKISGHVEYPCGEFKDMPEVREELLFNREGRRGQLVLRQWLMPAVVHWYRQRIGQLVTFAFRNVDVRMESENLDGEPGPIERLALPNEIHVDVPVGLWSGQ